ncbi:MAG: hypothetical protein J7525_19730 [Roseofilum sp. SID3]|uniref:hypothetical protein n=1 Tax=Roseofilum sp. SID3 TaxID=2821499 RepID=UPI001B08ACC9|nr:hypothetical protein [Roseofilum sp. SID3]MBP0015327.1 hypothetical protein [Roseofilum sp. SID3]
MPRDPRSEKQIINSLLSEVTLDNCQSILFRNALYKGKAIAYLKTIKQYQKLICHPKLTEDQVVQAEMMYAYSPETAVRYMTSVLHHLKTGERLVANDS